MFISKFWILIKQPIAYGITAIMIGLSEEYWGLIKKLNINQDCIVIIYVSLDDFF